MINKIKKRINWVKSTDGFAGLALFFTSVFFFYDLLGGRYILTERDLGAYFIPPRFFWVESVKNGYFPLWNPYQFSGHPFFANPQHAVLYPFNALFFLLPFDLAFNAIIILHFFLGGLFTYLFLKDLKTNVIGSLISGLIFMLGGYLLSVHSLLTILLSVIWTPLVMMFFRRTIANPGLKNELLTAVFITISFLGGGVEIVYGNFFVLLFMVFFIPFPDITIVGDKLRRYKFICSIPIYWGRIRSLLIISMLFLFLSAVQLLPFLELLRHSIRGSGISYQEATTWSFAPKDILLFFLPDAYGYFLDMKKYWANQCWFKTLYTGGLPFILSLIFFLTPHPALSPSGLPAGRQGERDRVMGFGKDRKLYLSLILFSLFLSLGKYNPFYPFLFKYFPFFNGIRYPVKFLYIFILVLSVTAGLGFQRLTLFSKETGKKSLKNLFIVLSLIFGLLLLVFILGNKAIEQFLRLRKIDFPDFNHLSVNLYHVKRSLFYLTVFFLFLRVGYEVRWRSWAKVLLIFFLTADLFGNMGFYGKERTSDYFQKTRVLEKISSDQGRFRIFSTGKTIAMDTPILVADASPLEIFKEKHLPSLNMLHQLYDVWGIDVIRLRKTDDLYRAFTSTPSISTTNLIDLYGVKYIISVTLLGEAPHLELIYSRIEGLDGKKEDLLKGNTIKLYRNHNYFPRAWLVKDFRIMGSKDIIYTMLDKKFDPRKEVLLEEEPPQLRNAERGMRNGKTPLVARQNLHTIRNPNYPCGFPSEVEFVSEKNNEVHLRVRAKEDVLLVLSDTYYPGWKVFVDGRAEKIYRANYNFRAVPLKPGEYEVRFIYHPVSFKIGMLVTLLTLVGIVAYFIKIRYS